MNVKQFGDYFPDQSELSIDVIEHHAKMHNLSASDELISFAGAIWAECKMDMDTDRHKKAFPYNPQFNEEHNGMDLRDYFASKAMQAILTGQWNITDPDAVTKKCYEYADAMIKGRK